MYVRIIVVFNTSSQSGRQLATACYSPVLVAAGSCLADKPALNLPPEPECRWQAGAVARTLQPSQASTTAALHMCWTGMQALHTCTHAPPGCWPEDTFKQPMTEGSSTTYLRLQAARSRKVHPRALCWMQ